MKFTKIDLRYQFRASKAGSSMILIRDGKLFTINNDTYADVKRGLIESITFKESTMLPKQGDLEPLMGTVIESVETTAKAGNIDEIDNLKVTIELKKLKKEEAALV